MEPERQPTIFSENLPVRDAAKERRAMRACMSLYILFLLLKIPALYFSSRHWFQDTMRLYQYYNAVRTLAEFIILLLLIAPLLNKHGKAWIFAVAIVIAFISTPILASVMLLLRGRYGPIDGMLISMLTRLAIPVLLLSGLMNKHLLRSFEVGQQQLRIAVVAGLGVAALEIALGQIFPYLELMFS